MARTPILGEPTPIGQEALEAVRLQIRLPEQIRESRPVGELEDLLQARTAQVGIDKIAKDLGG